MRTRFVGVFVVALVACSHARRPQGPAPEPPEVAIADAECERMKRENPMPLDPSELVSPETGAIADIATDGFGRPAPGALVVIEVGGEVFSTTADEEGWFQIGKLPPGKAKVRIHVGRFVTERDVRVFDGQYLDLAGQPATWGPPRGIYFCGASTLDGGYAAR
jgi:hypothetical protein